MFLVLERAEISVNLTALFAGSGPQAFRFPQGGSKRSRRF